MADIAALAFFVVFFAVAVALVRGCEHILGPDVEPTAEGESSEQVAA